MNALIAFGCLFRVATSCSEGGTVLVNYPGRPGAEGCYAYLTTQDYGEGAYYDRFNMANDNQLFASRYYGDNGTEAGYILSYDTDNGQSVMCNSNRFQSLSSMLDLNTIGWDSCSQYPRDDEWLVSGLELSCGCDAGNEINTTPSPTQEPHTPVPTSTSDIMCESLKQNDGVCDAVNNNARCEFDLGDCCRCENGEVNDKRCLDPSSGLHEGSTCASGVGDIVSAEFENYPTCGNSTTFSITDPASLTKAESSIRCKGGSFIFEWVSSVSFSDAVRVPENTTLRIIGSGEAESISKNFAIVIGGTLIVESMTLDFSAGPELSPIWVWDASVTFSNCTFKSSETWGNGGMIMAHLSSVSFYGNTSFSDGYTDSGGMLYLSHSDVLFNDPVSFSNGGAYDEGGSIASYYSNIIFNDIVIFETDLEALLYVTDDGGYIYAYESLLDFRGRTEFHNASSGFSGLAYFDSSNVTFEDITAELYNNGTRVSLKTSTSRVDFNGDIFASQCSEFLSTYDSEIVIKGNATLIGSVFNIKFNTTVTAYGNIDFSDGDGIAYNEFLFVTESTFNTTGDVSFRNGSTTYGWGGGCVRVDGVLFVGGKLLAEDCYSSYSGGGIYVGQEGSLIVRGSTVIRNTAMGTLEENNTLSYVSGALIEGFAELSTSLFENLGSVNALGGAIKVENGNVVFKGPCTIRNNSGSDGGGMYITESNVTWEDEVFFEDNFAVDHGGALTAYQDSAYATLLKFLRVSVFENNRAGEGGGAIHTNHDIYMNSPVFKGNMADSGGAIQAVYLDWRDDNVSLVNIKNGTFIRNTADVDGGALDIDSIQIDISGDFFNNSAGFRGGAVFLQGVPRGYVYENESYESVSFSDAVFEGNSASIGGAVYSVTSGATTTEKFDKYYSTPSGVLSELVSKSPYMIYSNCLFKNNQASSTGGAIESSLGNDFFWNCSFEGNRASEGGALRIGGAAILANCEFMENDSEPGHGSAIDSSLGEVRVINSTFHMDGFFCPEGTYLQWAPSTHNKTVDSSCRSCTVEDCVLELQVASCVETMGNTRSTGEYTSIEDIEIDSGYWRATSNGVDVRSCYNEDACVGGVTNEEGFCAEGYEGPYCAVCSDSFANALDYECIECLHHSMSVPVSVISAIALVGIAMALWSFRNSIKKRISATGLKIVVVVYQLVTQFASVAFVVYPDVYQRFLTYVDAINFNLAWIPSITCAIQLDFHDSLLISTLCPLLILVVIGLSYLWRGDKDAHVSAVLLISFLVYSGVSSELFQMFACDDLEDGVSYLRADYRIDCDSPRHKVLQIYSIAMIVVYPVGIPLLFLSLLLKTKDFIVSRTDCLSSSIWKHYKSKYWFWELVECFRRLMLTGVVVFIYPDTSAQIAISVLIALFFALLVSYFSPYESGVDQGLSVVGHIIVFLSVYMALLDKVDISEENSASQSAFSWVLVVSNVCILVFVIVESVLFCRSN